MSSLVVVAAAAKILYYTCRATAAAGASGGGSITSNTMVVFGRRWLLRSQPIVASSSRPIIPVVVDALEPRYGLADCGLGRRCNSHRGYHTGSGGDGDNNVSHLSAFKKRTTGRNNNDKILGGEKKKIVRRFWS